MNYDKNSFLAGISVGRTLKGWAGSGDTIGGVKSIMVHPIVVDTLIIDNPVIGDYTELGDD